MVRMCVGPATGANDSRMPDLAVEKGTIHTKRHSGEDPIKTGCVNLYHIIQFNYQTEAIKYNYGHIVN